MNYTDDDRHGEQHSDFRSSSSVPDAKVGFLPAAIKMALAVPVMHKDFETAAPSPWQDVISVSFALFPVDSPVLW